MSAEEIRDSRGNFEGFTGRECGDHRTVGDYRAWCHDCTEWCYPNIPCLGCERPQLLAEVDRLSALLADRDTIIAEAREDRDHAVRMWSKEVRRRAERGDVDDDSEWLAQELERLRARLGVQGERDG